MREVQIVVTMTAAGQINLNANTDNVVVCLGLLEVAKDLIRQRAKENARRIVPAVVMPTAVPRNGG